MKNYTISSTGIIDYVWDVRTALRRYGDTDQAERDLAPLVYYINTGRASCRFLRLLLETKPFLVARRLHAGGSVNDAISRVCSLIGYKPNA